MSENEYVKLRKQLRYLTVAVVALLILFAASIAHSIIDPNANSFPRVQVVKGDKGDKGDTQSIDYSAIQAYIDNRIASLPKPLNGTNGKTGANGGNGFSVTPEEIALAVADYLKANPPAAGQNGKEGSAAAPAPVLQAQVDKNTCQLQTKYDTSDGWISIAQLPKPCEVQ